jgi:hypothetical protein
MPMWAEPKMSSYRPWSVRSISDAPAMLARRLGVTVSYLETGDPLSRRDGCELHLLEAELELELAAHGDAAAAAAALEAVLADPELRERSPLRARALLVRALALRPG